MTGPQQRPRLPALDMAPMVSPCVCTVPHCEAREFSVGVAKLFPALTNAITIKSEAQSEVLDMKSSAMTIVTMPPSARYFSRPGLAIFRIRPP